MSSRFGILLICFSFSVSSALAATNELNPVRRAPVSLGPETQRIIVGFRATPGNEVIHAIASRRFPAGLRVVQANTTTADVLALAGRTGVALGRARQLTPSMHVLFLQKTLYGGDVLAALASLRADAAVQFADIDTRRAALSLPNDPLFLPTPSASPPASGQWYLQTPSSIPVMLEGNSIVDLAATDAVSAWNITTGSTGVVIADIDTGVRFDHPDLLRAGPASLGAAFGGRLLPGYDFVGEDLNSSTGAGLGTFLIANDGDGWDPDPSDPGDWINQSDLANQLFTGDMVGPSSWHGTRVVGVYGALTNNATGVAGMSWGPWILPVRALGKGGGYDSDIIAGIQWAAGMPVAGVPTNPYPADIINLSLGGSGSCPSSYQTALTSVTDLGVLVVAAAGNGGTPGTSAPVDAPANCSSNVPGVIAVAGLRNVGTKVGYSSFGAEVGIGAPAGNCIQTSGDCLRSIDTTTNAGTTVPDVDSYTNEQNPNLGTSFATPIVAGVAALMRSVNANLTPAQLVARLEGSATAFPANTGNLPVCPSNDASSGECSCPASGQCGSGMVNALSAVNAALQPIVAIAIPKTVAAGSVFDASGSLPACNPGTLSSATPAPLSLASFAWSAQPASLITSAANTAQVTVNPGSGGVLTLIVTDSAGNADTETVTLTADSATSSAPAAVSGSSATACPTALEITPTSPTVNESFAPSSVGENVPATLTITLENANGFDLTQSSLTETLPNNLTIPTTATASTTCTGVAVAVSNTSSSLSLSGAIIPAASSCAVSVTVQSSSSGTYTNAIAANALSTASAGGNTAAATAALTVSAPSKGGGAVRWPELLAGLALTAAIRRRRRA